jgi:hypothetical protein
MRARAQAGRLCFRGSNKRSEMGVNDPRKPTVTDELWEEIKPLLPPHPSRPRGEQLPSSDRAAGEGILSVLRSSIPWELLPAVFGVCRMTCWRRLRDWQAAGVWERSPRANSQPLAKGRKNRLDPGVRGLHQRASHQGRQQGGAQFDRPQKGLHKASSGGRWALLPIRRVHLGRERQRLTAARCSHRRHSASQRQTRASPQASAKTSRRQRLRSCQMQASLEAARDHPAHRPPRDRIQGALGTLPKGR